MNRTRRITFFVDRHVQGALLWRVIVYWQFFVISLTAFLVCRDWYFELSSNLLAILRNVHARYSPVMFASLILLPVVMLDIVRITNRIVGPIVRLRHGLRDMAEGRPVHPLSFRDNDFWRDLAGDFNRASARVAFSPAGRTAPTEEMPQTVAAAKS